MKQKKIDKILISLIKVEILSNNFIRNVSH
jgi:hypothetical protein